MYPNDSPYDVSHVYWNKMALIWRERDQEEQYMTIGNDLATIQDLRDCGLLKLFWLSSMRKHIELLRYLVYSWDDQVIDIQTWCTTLEIQVAENYFLTVLSRWGAPISLSGSRSGGEIIKYYISTHCLLIYQPTNDGKIYIKDVVCFPLRTIMFLSFKLVDNASLHVANKSHMQYSLEYL